MNALVYTSDNRMSTNVYTTVVTTIDVICLVNTMTPAVVDRRYFVVDDVCDYEHKALTLIVIVWIDGRHFY
jgi:hypothetical protein